MARMYDRGGRAHKAFGDGVAAQLAGGVEGDDPFTAPDLSELSDAWLAGFRAAAGPVAWTISTVYNRGDLVSNGGSIYACIVAGTSAGSGGPSGVAPHIVDNTAAWMYQNSGSSVDLSRAGLTKVGEAPYIPLPPIMPAP